VSRAGVALLVCLSLVVSGAAAAPGARQTARAVAAGRALEAYSAMQRYFYRAADGSYAGTYPAAARAQAWPFSQALWATIEVAALPGADLDARAGLRARLRALAAYSHPEARRPAEFASTFGGSGDVYYDDNLWIALALVEASRVLPGTTALATARQLFTLVGDGWDFDADDPCPGGVFWTRTGPNHDRNTVTTANAALLALRLDEALGSRANLAWAQGAYAWTRNCLEEASGLVADHIDRHGEIDPHPWSYNEGAMIAAGVHLYRDTGKRRYLAEAEKTANAALRRIGDPLTSGEPPVFLAIFYRDLLELTDALPTRPDRSASEAFADEAWTDARDPDTGLFSFDGRKPTLLDQAAMVQVYAELARG
jgi:predicted alpha-1,6-mannanase (GH76 family)